MTTATTESTKTVRDLIESLPFQLRGGIFSCRTWLNSEAAHNLGIRNEYGRLTTVSAPISGSVKTVISFCNKGVDCAPEDHTCPITGDRLSFGLEVIFTIESVTPEA